MVVGNTTSKTSKKRWTDPKKPGLRMPSLQQRKTFRKIFQIQNYQTKSLSVESSSPKYGLRTQSNRSPHYNNGYVIGGPFFVLGTVAEFASTTPQELLYVSEDGSIQGLPQPENTEESTEFALQSNNQQLEWADLGAPRNLKGFQFENNNDAKAEPRIIETQLQIQSLQFGSLFLETDANQCIKGEDPMLIQFWQQKFPHAEDDAFFNVTAGSYIQINLDGMYVFEIHMIAREQFSTVGKRCVILNVLFPEIEIDENDPNQDPHDLPEREEQSYVLLETQPFHDIDSDTVYSLKKLLNLEKGSVLSLSFHLIDATEEDMTCILPQALMCLKFICPLPDEYYEVEACPFNP